MIKILWNALKFSPAIVATLFAANSALAVEVNEQVTTIAQLTQEADSIGQVTSVSQFSDVQPTDWAFQALQSLVERYGCIAGYPNSTYRGNRALTRYEFAAGLNACLDRVNELIATATADVITRQDLATLQRLQEEFSAELATLRGRVDALEARTAELEANQFSTTTKLKGEAIFGLSQVFGDTSVGGADLQSNTTFSNRVRLTLNTSFTGRDKLETRLNSGNFVSNSDVTGTEMTRLGFDTGTGESDNNVEIDKVNYAFNLSDSIRVKIDATGAELNDNVNNFNPDFASSGGGALSRYGRFSPIYRTGSGGAGLTVELNPKGPLTLSAAYLAPNANNPENRAGLFDGDSTIFGQVAFKPSKAFNIGLAYARSYKVLDGIDSGTSDTYGVQASFQPSSKLTIGGWAGYSNQQTQVSDVKADVFYWATTLGIKDFGREGNLLGVIFGQPPKVTDFSVGGVDQDLPSGTSYHLEGLYKMRLTDNIAVTPGLLVIFNPENNEDNDTIYVGTIRTTFSF